MSKQVVVVEGLHDVSRLKQVFKHIHVISVNGSAIDEEQVRILISLNKTHRIILALDPDHAGERIRHILTQKLDHVDHVFFIRQKAKSKNDKKIGLEHMKDTDIIEAFSHIKIQQQQMKSDITSSFLYERKLVGHHQSKALRATIEKKLHIGKTNGKTLLKRLLLFGYHQKDIIEVLNETSS